MQLIDKAFDRIVKRAIGRISGDIRRRLDNLLISFQRQSSPDMLEEMAFPPLTSSGCDFTQGFPNQRILGKGRSRSTLKQAFGGGFKEKGRVYGKEKEKRDL